MADEQPAPFDADPFDADPFDAGPFDADPFDAELAERARGIYRYLLKLVATDQGNHEILARDIAELLAVESALLPTVTRTFASFELANVHLALAELIKRHGFSEVTGISGPGKQYQTYTDLLTAYTGDFRLGPPDYRTAQISPDEEIICLTCAMIPLEVDGQRCLIWLRAGDPDEPRAPVLLEFACPATSVAEALIHELEGLMLDLNIFRGKTMSMQSHHFEPGVGPLRFMVPAAVSREDLILPTGLLELVERQVFGVARQREYLRSRGQHLKRGILLYGPPGTGKTHLINYLLTNLPDFTSIVISGNAIERVADACSMARRLHPALVIVEDVDLIAQDRASAGSQPQLMQLLNELDGIGAESDIAFILTTNAVEVLERALAARPGRIDLAVEVPLPGAEERRRLFRLYGRGMLPEDVLDSLADRAEGVTASFAKEATRRAVLIAAEEQSQSGGTEEVAERHFAQALDELLTQRDALLEKLHASRAAGDQIPGKVVPGNYM